MDEKMRGKVVRLMKRREGISEEEAQGWADGFQRHDDIFGSGTNWYRGMLETYNYEAEALRQEERARIGRWIIALHFNHYPYEEIGKALGVTAAGARHYHKEALSEADASMRGVDNYRNVL